MLISISSVALGIAGMVSHSDEHYKLTEAWTFSTAYPIWTAAPVSVSTINIVVKHEIIGKCLDVSIFEQSTNNSNILLV